MGTISIGFGYALGQLARALGASADKKVAKWTRVLEGMASGSLAIGSRAPVAGTPPWVSLEVVTGGFATGGFVAGGALLPHEIALAERLGSGFESRAPLNAHFVGDEGRRELESLLASGAYRVGVPEEGALLVVTWLLARGHTKTATEILDAIVPWFDRLRFYPVPAEPRTEADRETDLVVLRSRELVIEDVERTQAPKDLLAMNEAILVRGPIQDRAIALWLETYVDGAPGGVFPEGWRERADTLRASLAAVPAGRVGAKSSVSRLLAHAALAAESGRLTSGQTKMIGAIVDAFVSRHGAPGSQPHAAFRAEQRRIATRPTYASVARVVAARLREQDGAALAPVSSDEAARFGVPEGAAVSPGTARKVARCMPAPIEHLVAERLVPSGAVLARVLPQITSRVRAEGFEDAALRALYAEIDAAFGRRRSLLLLWLAHQVRIEELPWVAPLAAFRGATGEAAARRSFERVAELALSSFPHAIVPNELLSELGRLAKSAKLDVPLVEEIAADIFMGTFSAKFVFAAKLAARVLGPTSLYARYYGAPFDRVMAIRDFHQIPNRAASSSPAFAELCAELALARVGRGSVAANGTILEQQQILTTQNLAALTDVTRAPLAHRALADTCFAWVCRRLRMKTPNHYARLIARKNAAYAWRQMMFHLSFVPAAELASFLEGARAVRRPAAFEPVVTGLVHVANGGSFDADGTCPGGRRFLGWTTQPDGLT